MRPLKLLVLLVFVTGCATLSRDSLDDRFGAADPARYDTPAPATGTIGYRRDVQPILERRCIVCHGCYDAPCQLKLGAWEGIARGASRERVYDGSRLLEADPTRLFVDAERASQWRGKGFFPVLNERRPGPAADLAGSVLYRALALKQAHPLPAVPVLPEPFDFSLDRTQSCPTIEEFADYEQEFPLGGMPYGLPGLGDSELETVKRWLEAGAPYEGPEPLSAVQQHEVAQWETFLNGDSHKQQLMARYVYEHLFLGHLHFESDPGHRFFRVVRSRTPPGEPVDPVVTRRPYDAPGVQRPYYRLVPEQETILDKTHMPYALSAARMAKYRRWFLDAAYEVEALPGYDAATATNPFIAFRALPAESRYRFLLDEAGFIIMTFIKGPVCRGQLALNVIEDRFWVFFMDPQLGAGDAVAEALVRQSGNLSLPAERGSNSGVLLAWREYAAQEKKYLEAKSRFLGEHAATAQRAGLDLVWDGDGSNDNAALTVFRHFDSASVVKGLVGAPPKTAWVIGYPLLERIYYLLVAGYDVYGNVGHQLVSRLYMDFLRMEGEFDFLVLLPQTTRTPTRDFWYRDTSDEVKDHVYGNIAHFAAETGIVYRSNEPQAELYRLLEQRLARVLDRRYDLDSIPDAALRADLEALAAVRGEPLSWVPETVFLRVDETGQPPQYFTVLRDTGHSNVSHVFQEDDALRPDEHALTVVPGFIGAYPNAIWRVARTALPELTRVVAALGSEDDYRALADRYAIRRTDPDFWRASDALMEAHQRQDQVTGGLLDYNRFENR